MPETLITFHLQISGNSDNDEHPLNKYCMQITLLVSHFEISGNDFKDEHSLNNPDIL